MTPRSSRHSRWQLAAIAVVAAFGVWVPGSIALAPKESEDRVGAIDRALDSLRARVGRDARVGLLLPAKDKALWYATQYALAPAIVVHVPSADCLRPASPACAPDATHLLLPLPDVTLAGRIGENGGFAPVASSGRFVLLERRGR